ncbi:MAG: hypothetical protein ABEJ97_08375 [Halobellus sp.]
MPMRQLRSCDFCGGDAAGVYAVVPPELSPTEAEQRRVILCADCRETLEAVLDPLLDRLGVDRDAESDGESALGDGSPSTASEAESEPESESASRSTKPPSGADDATNVTRSGESPSPPRSGGSRGSETPDERGVPDAFGAPEGYTDIAESDEVDLGGPDDDAPSDPTANGTREGSRAGDPAEPRDVRDAGNRTGEPESDVGAPAEDVGSDRVDATAAGERSDGTDASGGRDPAGAEPDQFRTVMRLLGNREFPVRRDEVVEVAASAYDLEDSHVDRILDHAVDRGVLEDDGGTLRRS